MKTKHKITRSWTAGVLSMMAVFLMHSIWVTAQVSLSTTQLTWEANETDTKYVTVSSFGGNGRWECDSTVYSNHFVVSPQSGSSGASVAITPMGTVTGDAIDGGIAFVNPYTGAWASLDLLHKGPSGTFSVSPLSLSWAYNDTQSKTVTVTGDGWSSSVSGSGFTRVENTSAGIVTVTPVGSNTGGTVRNDNLVVYQGDKEKYVWLRQEASGGGPGQNPGQNPGNPSIRITPPSLVWEAGSTETKSAYIVSGGTWRCDSTVVENHFSVSPPSGSSGSYVYVTPQSANAGGSRIEGGVDIGGAVLLVTHLTAADTLAVSPSSLTWQHDGTTSAILNVGCPGPWTATLTGVGFSALPLSGSGNGTVQVIPTGLNTTGNARTATLTFHDTTFGRSITVPLSQAAAPSSVPEAFDDDEVFLSDYAPGITIPYTRGVSPSGGMTYSVPIMTAPGLKNAPQISLVYNSHGGEGLAGYGWELGGLSAVSVSNRTVYYDGSMSAADADSPDASYSLDGLRLVPNSVSGLSSVWQYETSGGHVMVRKHTDADGLALWFEALYPNGVRATFGSSSATSPSAIYPVMETVDKDGNWVRYSYSQDTYTDWQYPVSIEYGLSGSQTAVASLSFDYVSKGSYRKQYLSGRRLSRPVMLRSVASLNGTDTLRKYTLVHEQRDGADLLRRVRMTVPSSSGTGTLEAVPLRFGYGEAGTVGAPTLVTGNSPIVLEFTPIGESCSYIRGKFVPGRYTDGLLIVPQSQNSGTQTVSMVPTLENGLWSTQKAFTISGGLETVQAVDTDGDGTDEAVGIARADHVIYAFIHRLDDEGNFEETEVHGFTAGLDHYLDNYRYYWGDFLGTGKTSLMVVGYRGADNNPNSCWGAVLDLDTGTVPVTLTSIFPGNQYDMNRVFTADFDGDGVTELCTVTSSGTEMWRVSSGAIAKARTVSGLDTWALSSGGEMMLTDLNADGYTDVVVAPARGSTAQWHTYTFDGKYFNNSWWNGPVRASGGAELFMDVDRDGLPDLVTVGGTTLRIWLNSEGAITGTYMERTNLEISAEGLVPCNIARLGAATSLMMIDGISLKEYKITPSAAERRHLRRFTGSAGEYSCTEYGYSSEYAGYDPLPAYKPSADSGYVRIAFPGYLVTGDNTRLTRTDPESKRIEAKSYSYAGAVFNAKGAGFCGFRRSAVTDLIHPMGVTSVTETDPERGGVPVTITVSGSGGKLSSDKFEYDAHRTSFGQPAPRLTGTESVNFLTGINTVETVSGYDAYDYPATITAFRRIGPTGLPQMTRRRLSYCHSLADSLYVLGSVAEDVHEAELDGNLEFTHVTKTVTEYDGRMRPVEVKEYVTDDATLLAVWHLAGTERFTYDAKGNVTSDRTAAYGATTYNETTYAYDAAGRYLSGSADPLGRTITYSNYNKYGNPAQTTDWLGRSVSYVYDAWGNATQKTNADGTVETTSVAWSSQGEPGLYCVTKTVTGQPDTKIWYDALGREVRNANRRFDGGWQYVTTEYDGRGRLYRMSLPYKDTVTGPTQWNTRTYDAYDRPVSLSEATGKQTTWSYSGTSTTTTKEGIQSASTTDAGGNVVSVVDGGGTITYTLRDDGQPSAVTVSPQDTIQNIVTTFQYDIYGRRTSMVDPSAGTRSDAYTDNADGSSSVAHTGPNGTVTTYYDRYGRVTGVTRPEFNTTYAYGTTLNSSYGKILSESSTNGTGREYTYDALGRTATETEHADSTHWLRKTYAYNATGANLGSLASIAYTTQDGDITTESFSYANGHNTGIAASGPGNTTINVFTLTSENALGQPTAVTTGGVSRTYGYTASGLPSRRRILNGQNSVIQDFEYSYEAPTGNMEWRKDNVLGMTESFYYDALNRLTAATQTLPAPVGDTDLRPYKRGTISVSYDSKGNILQLSNMEMWYASPEDPYLNTHAFVDWPESAEDRLAWMGAGMTSFDRPSDISMGSGQDVVPEEGEPDEAEVVMYATYEYNASGEKTRGTMDELGLSRIYLGGGQYERDSTVENGTVQRLFLGGSAYDAPMVLVKEGNGAWTPYNIGRDVQGSITHVTTQGGTLLETYYYDPWGNVTPMNGEYILVDTLAVSPTGGSSIYSKIIGSHGYTGHESIAGIGMYNANARLYDPVTGRFLSPDPLIQDPESTQNFNRYSYCLNNPLKYTDEYGEFWHIVIGAAIGGIINLATNWNQCDGFWEYAAAFGVGAAAGTLTAATGGATTGLLATAGAGVTTALIGGAATSATNSIIAQTTDNFSNGSVDWGEVGKASVIGGVSGTAGHLAGGWASEKMGDIVVNGFRIKSPVVSSGLKGLAGGAAGGMAGGFAAGMIITGNVKQAWSMSLKGTVSGGVVGGSFGAAGGYIYAKANNINPWTGKHSSYARQKHYSVYVGIDPQTGEIKYVGMTGRDVEIRAAEHLNSNSSRATLRYETLSTGLTKMEARILEQQTINQHGLSNLYNKINSIAPKYWAQFGIKP